MISSDLQNIERINFLSLKERNDEILKLEQKDVDPSNSLENELIQSVSRIVTSNVSVNYPK